MTISIVQTLSIHQNKNCINITCCTNIAIFCLCNNVVAFCTESVAPA